MTRTHTQGVTLIELAIVIAIIAAIAGMSMSMGSSMIESAKRASTNNKMNEIEAALAAYRLAYNRLPCPGNPTIVEGSAGFGQESANPGACSGGTPAVPAAGLYTLPSPPANTNIAGNTVVAEGAVPVRTLGLPDEFMVDGWGRKFGYAVWTPMTGAGAFIPYGVAQNCGGITMQNGGGSNRSSGAVYALISYGPDGYGGYLKSGTVFSATTDNADELTNASHVYNPGTYAATYVQHDWTQSPTDSKNVFDDQVRFRERWQMPDDYDGYTPNGLPCWPGFTINGATSSETFAYSEAVGDVNGDGIPDLVVGAYGGGGTTTGYVYVIFGTKTGFSDPLLVTANVTFSGNPPYFQGGGTNVPLAVGDVNGDGIDDIIIGSIYGSNGTSQSGDVDVIFGHSGSWASSTTVNSAFMNGTNGVHIKGDNRSQVNVGPAFGFSVAVADVNGDGIGDIIIGCPYCGSSGQATGYVQLTSNPGNTKTVILNGTTWTFVTNLASCPGGLLADCYQYKMTYVASGNTTQQTATQWASDLNSCVSSSCDANIDQATYVESGAEVQILATLNPGAGSAGPPATGNYYTIGAGTAPDVISGSTLTNGSNSTSLGKAGKVYVIFGMPAASWAATGGTINSAGNMSAYLNNGAAGIEFDDIVADNYAGNAVAGADINGDGIADVIIGAPYAPDDLTKGKVDVVFGKKTGWTSPISLTSGSTGFLNGENGFELDGAAGNDHCGWSLATGDVNGDGIPDMIIGCKWATVSGNNNYGKVDVVFGRRGSWPVTATTMNSTFLNGANGIEFDDTGVYGIGPSVAAGDINGDGYADIIIGAAQTNSAAGSAYVVFGGNPILPNTTVTTNSTTSATVGSYTGLIVGQGLYSSGYITAGTTITACGATTSGAACTQTGITLSASATASGTVPLAVISTPLSAAFLNGVNGFDLYDPTAADQAGQSVSTGDLNGDGISDIFIGAPDVNSDAGALFVYFGHKNTTLDPWPTTPFSLGGL